MDVILHLGAHRCGTTTLQQLMQRNIGALREAGVDCWTPDRTRSGMLAGLIQRPEDLTPQIEARARRSSGIVRIEIERLIQSDRRQLVISEENLIGAVRNNLRETTLYPKLDVRLSRLGPSLAEQTTRIGLAIRSYDAYWASSVAFGVAQGHGVPGPFKLDQLVSQPRRWRDMVRDIAQAFPKAEIVVWPFERLGGQPDAQLSVLTGGLRSTHLTGARDWHNPSPRLNKLRRILTMRGDVAAAGRLPDGDGRWTPFDKGQQATLRAQYLEDLDWLQSGADGLARFVERVDDKPLENISIPSLMTSRHYEVSGFAARPQPWVPPEGGRHSGKQDVMV
ncbi:hypothetical protein [Flavimaricola marinus]|uniref:Uncharacterized protein n=1 Tax=Flavimaricola marinus TaxID=1819565 RepID=A0A238LHU0_9RHOB|nr:hypothetical protein [Flavimaricola marinus]SMY08526.1 hypothetical protein LOM8899_02679 [Flavimaricola marinus]